MKRFVEECSCETVIKPLAPHLRHVLAMIFVNLKLTPSPQRVDEVIRALRLHIGPTEVQPGCVHCRLSQDPDEPNAVLYEEAWKSWDALDNHVRSNRFKRILNLMEASAATPMLTFRDVQETRGMEYVTKLREAKKNGADKKT